MKQMEKVVLKTLNLEIKIFLTTQLWRNSYKTYIDIFQDITKYIPISKISKCYKPSMYYKPKESNKKHKSIATTKKTSRSRIHVFGDSNSTG